VQANCAGAIEIATGGSATLNVTVYNQGANFLLGGSDASYTYSGNGNAQPATCSASNFSGVYTFNGTGFSLTGTSVTGAQNGAGLLQFDGVSQITANIAMSVAGAAPNALTLTGSYTISSNCLGSATLTDASANSYSMTFSVYNNTLANAAAYVGLTQSSRFLVTGTAHAAYGQPAPAAANRRHSDGPALGMIGRPKSGPTGRGGRA
jgi:hypothetical protein